VSKAQGLCDLPSMAASTTCLSLPCVSSSVVVVVVSGASLASSSSSSLFSTAFPRRLSPVVSGSLRASVSPFVVGVLSGSSSLCGGVLDSSVLLSSSSSRVRTTTTSSSSSLLLWRGLTVQTMGVEMPGTRMAEELPKKMQEIVKMFQAVPDPRAKYEQLLYYAKQLKPLGKEYLTPENKVQGCVSQVWVRPSIGQDDKRFYFEAESDSLLTKGLAALLVEGLSGSTAQEILAVTPDFMQGLGLNQSLTPSRNNGFLNMLKLMQKKTLQLYMESEEAASASSISNSRELETPAVRETEADAAQDILESPEAENLSSEGSHVSSTRPIITKKAVIEEKLEEALTPTELEVEDVSYQHAGHSGVERGSTETHFNVKVVSESFEGRSLLKRHRLVYDLLKDELQTGGVHALSLITKTPGEVTATGKS
jgi:sulfur transfer protein SufE/stress-induced morphogen